MISDLHVAVFKIHKHYQEKNGFCLKCFLKLAIQAIQSSWHSFYLPLWAELQTNLSKKQLEETIIAKISILV